MLKNGEKSEASEKEAEKKFAVETKVEEAEITAYMDRDNQDGEAPTEDERLSYLERRYQETKDEYRRLCLERDENEGIKRADLEPKLHQAFKSNYVARKYFVLALRNAGRPVKDRFIPG